MYNNKRLFSFFNLCLSVVLLSLSFIHVFVFFCLASFMTSVLLCVHSVLPIVRSVVGFEVSFSPHI